jgi:hypothetical protein
MTDLEKIRETVISEGWKLLMADVETKTSDLKNALTAPANTLDEIRVAQGRLFVYRELLALPAMIENALAQQEEDKNVEADSV